MPRLELPSATIDYTDTGSRTPHGVLVFLHGLLMDGSLWEQTVAALPDGFRCVVPTLPLGAHRHPLPPGADASLPAVARLVTELLEHLDLHDVTLVGNDTGGAVAQLVITGPAATDRIARVVLVSCEAFDNLPPGLTGRALALAGKLPPWAFGAFMQQMRLRPMRRLPIAFGQLTRRGDAVTANWLRPVLTEPAIRRDTVRILRAAFADRRLLTDAAERLPGFDRPALVVWAAEDKVMPPDHGRRLAALLPQAKLIEVDDSDTLVPLDQPDRLAAILAGFAEAP